MRRTLMPFLMACLLVIPGAIPGTAAETVTNTYFDLGVFAYEQGNYREALHLLESALKADPYDTGLYHYLGKTWLKLEQPENAAQYLEVVQKMDPGRVGLTYDLAILYQQRKDYENAFLKFKEVSGEEPENVLAVYHAGVSLYQLNRCGEAIDWLERAARMSPGVKANADYYAGVCYYRMDQPDAARRNFMYAKAGAPSDELRRNADTWLLVLQREEQEMKRYGLYVKTGMQYDDNVVLEPLDVDVFSDQSDWAFVGYLSGRYNLVNQRGLKAGAGYSHYQTRHSDLTDYDITGGIGNFFIDYRRFPYTLGFSYQPAYYWVHADSFLLRHAFTPEVSWQMNDRNIATVSYTYSTDNYFTDSGRDGHANAANLDLVHLFKGGYLTGGIGAEVNSARRGDEEYNEVEARFGIGLPVIEKIRLTLTGIYNEKDYEGEDDDLGITREDNRYYAICSLARPIVYPWLTLSLDYDYTRNDSNISLFDYERNSVTLSVAANL